MFINLSFVLNGHTGTTMTTNNLMTSDQATQIALFVAQNGIYYNSVNSFAEILRQRFFIDFNIAKEYIIELQELRLICANWCNLNATIGYDDNGNEILNTLPPQSLDELKQDAFFTANRDFGDYSPIYSVDNLDEAVSQFNQIIDYIIQYSKLCGTGDWNYYISKVTQNYDYSTLEQQIIDARNS